MSSVPAAAYLSREDAPGVLVAVRVSAQHDGCALLILLVDAAGDGISHGALPMRVASFSTSTLATARPV